MSGKRVTFYIDESLNEDISVISSRMGISKSILISKLLEIPLKDLRGLLAHLPESPSRDNILKFRGDSKNLINHRLSEMNKILDGV